MTAGTAFFTAAVDALSDDELRAASALDGWSRAHVVAHMARNAEALTRLANWARTGVETPMYSGPEQRNADIEATATGSATTLRGELVSTAETLTAALGALDDTTWNATLRSAQGRPMPALEVPWMRTREVWLHTVDLGTGATVADIPADVVDAVIADAARTLSTKDGCVAAVLEATDRDETWVLGSDAEPVRVRGAGADLLSWLVGRTGPVGLTATSSAGASVEVPTPPRWL
ncbi:maleylpyruvate isomerase family mycothiol-dependent enzyme [Pseudonocardia sp. GCM10023141]|uniref:maleylpyruvate isomerase family mycothiol-dependent enzyme n=1 Tax=Pseudonocardia sp. GCM10023141 TaxID=3252653 RepID=UPI003607F045